MPEREMDYVNITDSLKAYYCRTHENVDFICSKENPHPGRDPHFCKFSMLLYAFLKGYDWAVWMDADAAPVNMDFDIVDYLSKCDQTKMVIAEDVNGLNSGVFAMPNTDKSDTWLRMLDTEKVSDFFSKSRFWDQDAIVDSLKTEYFRDFTQAPDPGIGFNSYENIYPHYGDVELPNEYRKGHWVLHIPGTTNTYRARRFLRELERAKRIACPVCGAISHLYFSMPIDDGLTDEGKAIVNTNEELLAMGIADYHYCPLCHHIFSPTLGRLDKDFLAKNIYNADYGKVCKTFGQDFAEHTFDMLKAPICGKQERVLDYGAGKGEFAALLRQTGLAVDSFDPFFGKAKVPPSHLKYSLVTCINALQNIYDWNTAFADFRRLLVPGGTLLAFTPVWDDNMETAGLLPYKWGFAAPARGDVCIASTKSLEIMAARHGLNYIRESSNTFMHIFEKTND